MTDIKDLIAKIEALPVNEPLYIDSSAPKDEYRCPHDNTNLDTSDIKALVQRLEQAEKVIGHYADVDRWYARADGTDDEIVYACPFGNGYDKARQYLSEGEKKWK